MGRGASNQKVQPQYKGYIRSGAMLFGNMAQNSTWDQGQYEKYKRDSQYEALRGRQSQSVAAPTGNQQSTANLGSQKSPLKHKDYVQRTIDQAAQYSPDFNLKKINHYDNTIKNVPRKVLENYDLKKPFRRETLNKHVAKNEELASFVNLGSSFGPGGRAVLYAAVPKKDP